MPAIVTPKAIANTLIRTTCRIALSLVLATSLRGQPPHHKAFVTGFAKNPYKNCVTDVMVQQRTRVPGAEAHSGGGLIVRDKSWTLYLNSNTEGF